MVRQPTAVAGPRYRGGVAGDMHPRIGLMYRYVEEYTNAHDTAVAREIMHPDYRFTMGGSTIDLVSYLGMVENALGHFTDLRLVVDRLIVGPDRLAMVFHETATSPRSGAPASWQGVALYDFHEDGRLAGVVVEQDFWGRRRQYAGDVPAQTPGTTDPAIWHTEPGADQPATRVMIQSALRSLGAQHDVTYDDGSPLLVDPTHVEVNDVVVSDREFAAAVTIHGGYLHHAEGPELAVDEGHTLAMSATGFGRLIPGVGIAAHFITDRYGMWTRHREDR